MDQITAIKIELLEGAYKRLDRINRERVTIGICECLESAATELRHRDGILYGIGPHYEAAHALFQHIGFTLSPWSFYQQWLSQEGGEYASYAAIRRGRLAWIDAMIAALREGRELPDTPSLPSDYKPRPSPAPEQNFYRI